MLIRRLHLHVATGLSHSLRRLGSCGSCRILTLFKLRITKFKAFKKSAPISLNRLGVFTPLIILLIKKVGIKAR